MTHAISRQAVKSAIGRQSRRDPSQREYAMVYLASNRRRDYCGDVDKAFLLLDRRPFTLLAPTQAV